MESEKIKNFSDRRNILKVDLDLKSKKSVLNLLNERLNFLNLTEILEFNKIEDIILIKKSKYSIKIILKKELIVSEMIIILQSVLGDDWKRTAITFRDYYIGLRNWNRLFDIKLYSDSTYKFSKEVSIYQEVKELIKK